MTYEQLSELFKRYAGLGRGIHLNHASTTRSANPRYLYFPNSPNTTESSAYGAWDKYPCDAQTLSYLVAVAEKGESITYVLGPAPSPYVEPAGVTKSEDKFWRLKPLTAAAEVRSEGGATGDTDPTARVAQIQAPLVIDDAFFREWEPQYDRIESDEPEYQRLLSVVSREIASTGTISKETFLDIWRWKGAIRAIRHVLLEQYDDLYAEAFRKAYSEEPERKLDVLFGLPGILAPSASTLIHLMCPQTMPIIDVRTVEVLFEAGLIKSRSCGLKQYGDFCRAINGIKGKFPGWSLRQIDRALFAYHKIVMDQAAGNCC